MSKTDLINKNYPFYVVVFFPGDVTTGDILTVLPFGNQVDIIKVTGKNLREQIEFSVSEYTVSQPNGAFLQVSGKYN